MKKKVAVIGSGIAGLSAAYFLQNQFNVTLLERNQYLGGHANTQEVKDSNKNNIAIDTGFIVYNELTYPNLTKLFRKLEVATSDSSMSFSFYNSSNHFEYGGGSLSALFADPKNLVNWSFYRMLKDIFYFYKKFQNNNVHPNISVRQYLKTKKYSDEFIYNHLLPLISSIWSSPNSNSLDQPLTSVISFFQNHKLFNFLNRPQWKTVKGGSRNYINKIIQSSHFDIKTSFKIDKIIRHKGIEIFSENMKLDFDFLVLACPPHNFLPLIEDKKEIEISILNTFDFKKNLTQLHQNSTLMPPHKKAWSSWNFLANTNNQCTLSYWMNKLQSLKTQENFFVSLNQNQRSYLYQTVYEHPIFSINALKSQKNIGQIQGLNNTYYAGSYLGYGFHEDGIQSALKICKKLKIELGQFDKADTSRIQWN